MRIDATSLRPRPVLRAVNDWRRARPFWGAVWMMLAGYLISLFATTGVAVVVAGWPGTTLGVVLGVSLVAVGLATLFLPAYRVLLGVVGMAAATASVLSANLGAFGVGILVGILGGSMTVAWEERA